jgi:selenocysteine lyase/cysteine desulfurase
MVRREIARLFGARPAGQIVLAPGMLSGLRQLFSSLHIERLALTTEEYYAPSHFPAVACDAASPSTLAARVAATSPGAVIASVVSWRGTPLPVSALFDEIRRALGARTPLLVADYTHAGAIGFPAVSDLNADVVSGDPEKWLLPPGQRSRLAFLWIRSPSAFRHATRAFSPFFLALEGRTDERSARWIDPRELREVAAWLSGEHVTRRALRDRHQANLRMKHRLARKLGVASDGDASVLWIRQPIPRALESRLARLGLLWHAEDGRARILCRADAER